MSSRFEIRGSNKRRFRSQKFWVATIGNNNKVLQTSELLNSREACYKNIAAVSEMIEKATIVDVTK